MFTARTATFLTALGYVLMGNKIRADQVFIITTYYQLLRQTITVNFPNGLSAVIIFLTHQSLKVFTTKRLNK